jgi:hypothetical protein
MREREQDISSIAGKRHPTGSMEFRCYIWDYGWTDYFIAEAYVLPVAKIFSPLFHQ